MPAALVAMPVTLVAMHCNISCFSSVSKSVCAMPVNPILAMYVALVNMSVSLACYCLHAHSLLCQNPKSKSLSRVPKTAMSATVSRYACSISRYVCNISCYHCNISCYFQCIIKCYVCATFNRNTCSICWLMAVSLASTSA